MILKSISHKSSSVRSIQKLIDYVFAPEKLEDKLMRRKKLVFKKNIRGYDPAKWTSQFKTNDDNRRFKHSKRTVLRHEIIAFSDLDNTNISEESISSIVNWYLKNRSPCSLVVCGVHWESSVHLHFIISAVGVDSRSTRIERKDFNEIKVRLQDFQKEHFPELNHSIVDFGSSKKKSLKLKLTQSEEHMKRKRNVISNKEVLSKAVVKIANSCKSFDELTEKLEVNGIKPYWRNDMLTGVWFGNKKFRFSTLGVGKEHLKQLSIEQKRLDKLRQIQKDKYNDREREH